MGFIYRPNKHEHDMPDANSLGRRDVGAIWECSCGSRFKLIDTGGIELLMWAPTRRRLRKSTGCPGCDSIHPI